MRTCDESTIMHDQLPEEISTFSTLSTGAIFEEYNEKRQKTPRLYARYRVTSWYIFPGVHKLYKPLLECRPNL
jgi:hypothetical protein